MTSSSYITLPNHIPAFCVSDAQDAGKLQLLYLAFPLFASLNVGSQEYYVTMNGQLVHE